jgi:translocation and assembly module TamB
VAIAVAATTIAVAALLVGGSVLFLRSPWGSKAVLGWVVRRVNSRIAGRLAVGRLAFGGRSIRVEAVELDGPDGAVVARVGRVEVDFSPLALLRRELSISRLLVARPSLTLRKTAAGWNLSRALAPRTAPAHASPPPEEPSRGRLEIASLRVEAGTFDVVDEEPAATPREVRLAALAADGAGRFDAGTGDFDGRLQLSGRAQAPLVAPLALEVLAQGHIGAQRGELHVQLGRGAIDAEGELDRDRSFRLVVERAHLPAEVLRAFAPALSAKAPVDARAALTGVGTRGHGKVAVTVAGGRLDADVDVDAAARSVRALEVAGRHLDLGAAFEGLPRSDLSFELAGRAAGATLDDLVGELRLSVARGTLGGHAFGPARLEASAARGALRVTELRAALPGATVNARGAASRTHLAVGVDVDAHDLAATARSLAPLVPPHLTGSGHLRLRLGGTLAAPSASVEGRFASLVLAGVSASALAVSARWPNLRRPLFANVSARIGSARLRDHELTDVAADVVSSGLDFKLGVSMKGRDALGVAAAGRWHADRRGLSLASLILTTPELRWQQAPQAVDLSFEPGRLHVQGLDLRAAEQRVRADVALEGERLRATVDIAELDPQRLPGLLLPATPPAGRLDARARLDVPARWPPPPGAAPIVADVEVHVSELGAWLPLAGLTRPRLAGSLALSLELEGTVANARLAARAEVAGAALDGENLGDLQVDVRAQDAEPTRVSLKLEPAASGRGAASIELSTPLTLSRLLTKPPATDAWLRTPFDATGSLQGVPLGLLARLGGRAPLDGTLAARFSARGTPLAPTGALEIEVHGASRPRLPPTDLRADVTVGERELRFAARVWRAGGLARLVAWANGVARIAPGRLADLAAIEEAPLEVRVGLGPLEARRRTTAGEPDLEGRVRLEGSLTGTARAPTVSLRADAEAVSVSGASLGTARATIDYADRQAKLEATVGPAGGGALRLSANARADLGVAAWAGRLDPARWPVDATLEADRFDVRWLTVIPQIRTAAGTLTASLHVRRGGGGPQVAGHLDWAHGALTLAGLGAYENVHLAAHVDATAITIDELAAESSGGHARLAGALALAGAKAPLRLSAKLDRFPVYSRGQILGRVSADASVDGKLAERALDLHVNVPDAHVELAERSTRKVQSLDRPDDIVILENGRPVGGEAAGRAPRAPARPFLTHIVVEAPRNVWVRGQDANVELGFSPGFRIELGAEQKIYGRVVVRRGRVDVVGRRFDIQAESRAEFTGAADQPLLDVTAKHYNESANVTVVVTIKGPIDALEINISAPDRPDLTETQLYTLIVSGRLDLGVSGASGAEGNMSSAAASLVGGALAGALQKVIAPRLPLDVFSFDTGDGLTGSRLEAGRNLGSKLYLGYVGRAGANPALLQNRNAVHLEYQFSSRWSLDAEYGDVGTGTADLFWTKRY